MFGVHPDVSECAITIIFSYEDYVSSFPEHGTRVIPIWLCSNEGGVWYSSPNLLPLEVRARAETRLRQGGLGWLAVVVLHVWSELKIEALLLLPEWSLTLPVRMSGKIIMVQIPAPNFPDSSLITTLSQFSSSHILDLPSLLLTLDPVFLPAVQNLGLLATRP